MTKDSEKMKNLLTRLKELSEKHLILQQDMIKQRAEINNLKAALKEQVLNFIPLKQGLKHSLLLPLSFCLCPYKPYSNKTRIETKGWRSVK